MSLIVIEIINAKEEAFDADFSNLTIDIIYIDGSGDEGKPLIYASQAIQDARPAKQEHMV